MTRRLIHAVVERLPFYPLSALSMLAGCYTLSHALDLRPGRTARLLVLLVTVNLYEALLIALGLFLTVRKGLAHDGRTLLLLEVLFLADVVLINGECVTADLLTGTLVTGASLVLAILKVAVVLRVLDGGTPRPSALSLAPPGVLLFSVPVLFAFLARGRLLTPATVYAAWWAAALAVVVQSLLLRAASPAGLEPGRRAVAEAFRRQAAIALPASSLLHLVTSGWIHTIEFHVAYLAPVVVALAMAAVLVEPEAFGLRWRLGLPVAAVVLSLGAPEALLVHGPLGVPLSPLRLALVASALAYLLGYVLHGARAYAWAAGLCFIGAAAGHSVAAIVASLSRLWSGARAGGRKVIPRTAAAWGVVAVASAFVLLGLGALSSLLKARRPGSARRGTGLVAE